MVSFDRAKAVGTALKLLRGMLLLGILLIGWLSWTSWPQPPVLDAPMIERSTEPIGAQETHALAWYAPLWERDLKQPPIPPLEPKKEPNPAESAGPVPTLLATCVNSGESYAHLVDRRGRVVFKTVDESVDHFRLVEIEPGRVRLVDGARDVWLEMPLLKKR